MTITLERVKPTEPAILELVRAHYSHRDNVEKRPRTEKTSKTWWSNARLVVFSDPERTLVFAWQWPKETGFARTGRTVTITPYSIVQNVARIKLQTSYSPLNAQ